MNRIYLFILSPLHHSNRLIDLIKTSSKVSIYNSNNGSIQWLYKHTGANDYELNRWKPNYKLDMNVVNRTLNNTLDKNKQIWVETSSPNICRANEFQNYFEKIGKVYFIIVMNHPYAKLKSNVSWEEYGKYQKNNLKMLQNTIYITYEDCCTALNKVILQLKSRIPELGKLTNTMNNIPINYKEIINKRAINTSLYNKHHLLHFFGYNIMYEKIYESKDGKLRGFYNEIMDYNIKHGYDIEIDEFNDRYTSWHIDTVSEAEKLAAPYI